MLPPPSTLLLLFLLPLSSGDSCSKEVEQLRLEVESMRLENSLARDQMMREQERLKAQVEEQEVGLAALQAVPHGNLPRVEVGSHRQHVVFGRSLVACPICGSCSLSSTPARAQRYLKIDHGRSF